MNIYYNHFNDKSIEIYITNNIIPSLEPNVIKNRIQKRYFIEKIFSEEKYKISVIRL